MVVTDDRGTILRNSLTFIQPRNQMKFTAICKLSILPLFAFALGNLLTVSPLESASAQPADETAAQGGKYDPVDNVHHFMEYGFGPLFGDLGVKKETLEEDAWYKQLKTASLLLGECSTLLAQRAPKSDDVQIWLDACEDLHRHSTEYYQAARKKDDQTLQASYDLMRASCKKCHGKFKK